MNKTDCAYAVTVGQSRFVCLGDHADQPRCHRMISVPNVPDEPTVYLTETDWVGSVFAVLSLIVLVILGTLALGHWFGVL